MCRYIHYLFFIFGCLTTSERTNGANAQLIEIAVAVTSSSLGYLEDDETRKNSDDDVENVCSPFGCDCQNDEISCSGIAPAFLSQKVFDFVTDVSTIRFTDCYQPTLDFGIFANATSLRKISVENCGVEGLFASRGDVPKLRNLSLRNNYIANWTVVCNALRHFGALELVDLSSNHLESISSYAHLPSQLRSLNVSNNKISVVDSVPSVEVLDVSSNVLSRFDCQWPQNLRFINLSMNPSLHWLPTVSLTNLTYFNVDFCGLTVLPIEGCKRLQHLSARYTNIEFIDFKRFGVNTLEFVDFSNSSSLSSVLGQLPENVGVFRLTHSLVRYFPPDFFRRSRKLKELHLHSNPFSCNYCLIQWRSWLPRKFKISVNCSEIGFTDCSIGVYEPSNSTKRIIRARVSESALLPCEAFGSPSPSIEWWLVSPETRIGSYKPADEEIVMFWTRNDSYRVIPGGNLVIMNADRELVERYRCVATNSKGNSSAVIHFRLSYADWYNFELFNSVFWGSVVASILLCAFTFVFNILWIISRKTILWWINRAERLSRVRSMVEACEKYRQRQMENLHETYHRKVEQIRENYHQQVEQLRMSYSSQAERFRGYRAAQLESMNQHLENIRENYNQQMCRLRDYGSRRVEQLWESYERQMNRVRTFSLQQRLRLMRQYRVKQRYVNKLFAKFSDDRATTTLYQPNSEPLGPMPEISGEVGMSRSASYYSLPEYVLGDDGEVHCPPRSESRMFSRHTQPCSPSPDEPSTSHLARQRKSKSSTSSSIPANMHRHLSFVDQSASSHIADSDTPSTSKMEDP